MFLNKLKNNLKKALGEKYYTAFNFDDDSFQFIELKKYNDYYLPIVNKIFDSSEFITRQGVFYKKETIRLFKNIFKMANSNMLTISEIDNKKLQSEIISALKIAGFEKINIKKINFENILSLLIKTKNLVSRYPRGQRIFNAIFLNKKIHFFLTQGGLIKNKKIINSEILDYDSISEFLSKNELDEQEVYISGEIEPSLEEIKEMFYIFNLKIHVVDIWQNIVNTKEKIPKIFFLESHKYIKSISLALPNLLKIVGEMEGVKEEDIIGLDDSIETSKPERVEKKQTQIKKEVDRFELLKLSSFRDKKEKKEKKIVLKKEKSVSQKIINFFKQEVPSTVIGKKKTDSTKTAKNKKEKKLQLRVFKPARVYYLAKKEQTKKILKKRIKSTKLYLPKRKRIFLPKTKADLSKVKVAKVNSASSKLTKNNKKVNFKEKITNFLNKKVE